MRFDDLNLLNNRNSSSKELGKDDHNYNIKNNSVYNVKKDGAEYGEYFYYNQTWLKRIFKKYYFNYFSSIILPEKINLREFGFRQFDGKIIRHMSFVNSGELYAYILKSPPSDIYCSSSFYRNPSEDMDKKEWYGSELIFDIDGKDLYLDCAKEHNYINCQSCGIINKGILKSCSNCNSPKLSVIDIPCKNCIFFLKEEVKKLKKFLIEDFGIDAKTIYIYFSGNNGFHVHVTDDSYYYLASNERSEITGYLMGKGFKLETIGIKFDKQKGTAAILKSKRLLDIGWRGRILRFLKINLSSIKDNDILKKNIEKLEKSWNLSFQQIVSKAVEDISVKLDPVVTMDIHRIFRLPGSLNSKSGLAKVLCTDIDSFDPFKDASFYDKSEVKIDSKVDTTVYFKGRKFMLNDGINEVPEYLAIYLISKGLVNINLKEVT
jgi:DNA primase small subunit